MTILVTGSSGILGRTLIKMLEKMKINYIGTYHSRSIPNSLNINFENENEIYSLLKEKEIKICINCIVQRQIEICENNWNEIKRVNIDIVDKLSRQCNLLNIYLIHISTDYVFDGKKAPYYPESETNPLQNYGISKLISEKRIIQNMISTAYTIIRVPVLYNNNYENLSENAVTIIGKKILNEIEETSEDNYSIRRPVYIDDFCDFILCFINKKEIGIYHYYNPVDKGTKYDTVKMIANYLGKNTKHIVSNQNGGNMTNRPYDTELKDNKYDIYKYHKTSLNEGIEKCFSRWKHPSILNSPPNTFFLLMDLDGTILNTDKTHYKAYKKIFDSYNIQFTYEEFEKIINESSMETFILSKNIDLFDIKNKKLAYLLEDNDIEFIKGADLFLEHLIRCNINYVIVTNTSSNVVEHYKNCLPLLRKVSNWITREDYIYPKPNSEAYEIAIQKYYKNEKCKIGFENTLNGYESIKEMVNYHYFITNKSSYIYNKIKKEDIYLIKDYMNLLEI
jgi:dTDP-4-dehydrorhamnose reductase/beta-phosphoglucomutase-like phosphatase (HAD superfamily)